MQYLLLYIVSLCVYMCSLVQNHKAVDSKQYKYLQSKWAGKAYCTVLLTYHWECVMHGWTTDYEEAEKMLNGADKQKGPQRPKTQTDLLHKKNTICVQTLVKQVL